MKNRCITLFSVLLLASCQPSLIRQKTPETPALNKFSDATLQQIYTLQDMRNTQELLPYLQHSRSEYRRETALAFASVQDTLAIPALLGMLTDTTVAVRQAAAYAIGQIGHKKATNGLYQHIRQEKVPYVQATLLEALGKVIPTTDIPLLVSFSAPEPASMAGQAWGIYRAGLRQVHSPQAIEKAVQFLEPGRPYEVRLAAAHFLARTIRIDLHPYRKQLITAATSDAAPEVRMAVTQALAKVNAQDKAVFLSGIAQSDPDYRVRLSAIRSMAGLEFNPISAAIVAGLTDENINVAVATAEFLQANHRTANLTVLQQTLNKIQDGRVRAGVLWVVLKNSPLRERFGTQVKGYYANSPSPYDKAHFLKALAADYNNHKFIEEQTFSTDVPVVATYGMEALVTMRQQPDFPKALEQEFARIFKRGVASDDVALVGLAAGILRDPKLNFRSVYSDFNFLKQAQQKLVLPRDMETNIELQKTIDYLNGRTVQEAPQNPFTHPIDWAAVGTIPAEQQAVIRTAKGDITLQLFVEDAPGSVANFVELTRQNFYNDLYFHRVVPNFVAQGGDKRGDGWGSSDYSIRSEFAPLSYREGYVGMASAGKDTESNQWFITHSPTPHLDGRYTIFAKVIDGMEVVHQLKVGDKILTVELK